jgi:hypothetical protein
MSTIAETNSLFEIDAELDGLLDAIEEQTEQNGEPADGLVARFQQFCEAHGEKVAGSDDSCDEWRQARSSAAAKLWAIGAGPQFTCPLQRRARWLFLKEEATQRLRFRGTAIVESL